MQCLIEVDKADKSLEKAPVMLGNKVIGFCNKIVHNDIIDKDMVELHLWDDIVALKEDYIEFKENKDNKKYKDYWEWR